MPGFRLILPPPSRWAALERAALSFIALALFAGLVLGATWLGSLAARRADPPPETAKGCAR